jgi:hypothetical protein
LVDLSPVQRTRLARAMANLGAAVARLEEAQPSAGRDLACRVDGEALA